MKLSEILVPLKALAPEKTAEQWDNVGLQIGDLKKDITRALLTVDITNEVIEEAVMKNCQLIIAHHPLIFKPIKNLSASSLISRLVAKAIKNDIAIYIMHTNLDLSPGGVNYALKSALGFNSLDVRSKGLVPLGYNEYVKVVTFVPQESVELVRTALWESNAGQIGNYDHCSFELDGLGRFRPLEGSQPFIGNEGAEETVNEIRIETIIPLERFNMVVEKIKQNHPYEEPVIDGYLLQYPKRTRYMGEIVKLNQHIALENIQKSWGKPTLYYGDKVEFKNIAILGGSGSMGLEYAIKNKVDLYITGELDYHELIVARQEGLSVLLLGHGASEAPVLGEIAKILPVQSEIATAPYLNTP